MTDDCSCPPELVLPRHPIGRDLCLLGVGMVGLRTTPPSVAHYTDHTAAIAMAWAWIFVIGTLTSLTGILLERPLLEIAGSLLVGVAFAVWTIAALTQPVVTSASWQVSLVFLSGVFGQGYRVWMIADRRVRR